MTDSADSEQSAELVAVSIGDVEREFSRQFESIRGSDATPVPRLRMSNLVIYCDCPNLASNVAALVPNIVAVHPARVLFLIGDPNGPEANPTAAVRIAGCRVTNQQRVCSEEVVLRAGGSAVDRLPFAVRAMLVGDLPVNLWWASTQPPALAGSLVGELGEYAQQVTYDSLAWTDPARGVAATAGWLEKTERCGSSNRWRVASDLNWRRLKYWRRIVTQSLNPGSAPGAAESITELEIEHGPHAVIQAWELVSWIAQRLGWRVEGGKLRPGVEITWTLKSPCGGVQVRVRRLEQGPAEIRRVRIACSIDGKPVVMRLEAAGDGYLTIHLEGVDSAPRSISVPPHTPEELIARQLSDRERDVVFRQSMAVAQSLAKCL